MLPKSKSYHKCIQAKIGVDNSKYCMEPAKPLLPFRAYKLNLKHGEMYSGSEHSNGAAGDIRLSEK